MKPQFILKAAAVIAVSMGFSFVATAQSSHSEQISTYMQQARMHANQAATDLALLQTYSMAGIPWQVHFNRLQHIEDDLNALVKDYNRLNALRDSATPAQVQALNTIQPLLQDMQTQVKETLRFLNYNSSTVNMPPFTQRVRAQSTGINQIFAALCNCAKKNNVLVASANDRTAPADCSSKSSVMH